MHRKDPMLLIGKSDGSRFPFLLSELFFNTCQMLYCKYKNDLLPSDLHVELGVL